MHRMHPLLARNMPNDRIIREDAAAYPQASRGVLVTSEDGLEGRDVRPCARRCGSGEEAVAGRTGAPLVHRWSTIRAVGR